MFDIFKEKTELKRRVKEKVRQELDTYYSQQLNNQRHEFSKKIKEREDDLDKTHHEQLTELREQHDKEIAKLHTKYSDRIKHNDAVYKKNYQTQKDQFLVKLKEQDKNHSQELNIIHAELEDLRATIADKDVDLKNAQKAWDKFKKYVFELNRYMDILQGLKKTELDEKAEEFQSIVKYKDMVEIAYRDIHKQTEEIEGLLKIPTKKVQKG